VFRFEQVAETLSSLTANFDFVLKAIVIGQVQGDQTGVVIEAR
jgi:hypothetical protein